jgi:hypothetical protein
MNILHILEQKLSFHRRPYVKKTSHVIIYSYVNIHFTLVLYLVIYFFLLLTRFIRWDVKPMDEIKATLDSAIATTPMEVSPVDKVRMPSIYPTNSE